VGIDRNLHMILGNDLDDLTLSASPAPVATLPETNMQKQARGKIMRVNGTSVAITANRPTVAAYASGFGLARHNLKNSSTVRLRLYDDQNQTGNVVYDSTALSVGTPIPWGVMRAGIDTWGANYEDDSGLPAIFSLWFDAVAYRSLQIDVSAPDNTDIDIGRLFMGWAFAPTVNFNYGSAFELIDNSKHTRTAGGSLRTENVEAYRRASVDLQWLTDIDRERLSHELAKATKGGDILLSLDPGLGGRLGLEQTMIAKRVNNSTFTPRFSNTNSTKLTFEEV